LKPGGVGVAKLHGLGAVAQVDGFLLEVVGLGGAVVGILPRLLVSRVIGMTGGVSSTCQPHLGQKYAPCGMNVPHSLQYMIAPLQVFSIAQSRKHAPNNAIPTSYRHARFAQLWKRVLNNIFNGYNIFSASEVAQLVGAAKGLRRGSHRRAVSGRSGVVGTVKGLC